MRVPQAPNLVLQGHLSPARADPLLAGSALLDLVALGGTETLVRSWGEGLADLRRVLRIAGANFPLPGHARGGEPLAGGHLAAAAEEEHGHLHAGPADLHLWLVWVGHHVLGESTALVEGPGAHVAAQHRLALDVDHLVDVKLASKPEC